MREERARVCTVQGFATGGPTDHSHHCTAQREKAKRRRPTFKVPPTFSAKSPV